MPLVFVIDRERDVVWTRARGEVCEDDLVGHAAALAAEPTRPQRELVDFSDRSELTVSTSSVRATGEFLRAHDVSLPGSKVAMVAGSEAVFGMLRLYQAHREADGVAIRVFRDRGEALAWLGVADAEAAPQLTEST